MTHARNVLLGRLGAIGSALLLVALLIDVTHNFAQTQRAVTGLVNESTTVEQYATLIRDIAIEAAASSGVRTPATLPAPAAAASQTDPLLRKLAAIAAPQGRALLSKANDDVSDARRISRNGLYGQSALAHSRDDFAGAQRTIFSAATIEQQSSAAASSQFAVDQRKAAPALIALIAATIAFGLAGIAGFAKFARRPKPGHNTSVAESSALVRSTADQEAPQTDRTAIEGGQAPGTPPPGDSTPPAPETAPTALDNRALYEHELERELADLRTAGGCLALVVLDVDDRGRLSSEGEHWLHGDAAVAAISELLIGVRDGARSFHLEGEEFVVIMPQASESDALAVMERICSAAPERLGGASLRMGIAAAAATKFDAISLYEDARAALLAVKRSPKAAVAAPARDASSNASGNGAAVDALKADAVCRLIDDGQMEVVFQPIWDIEKSASLGFEALVRPPLSSGLSGPREAFTIAAQIDRGTAFDLMCLQTILKRADKLPPSALLFLKLVPQTIEREALPGRTLVDSVTAAGLKADRIVLEIAENAMSHVDVVAREANRLHEQGFRLALAECGGGKAQLHLLRQVAFDFVKIDRQLLLQAMTDHFARAVVTAIVEISCSVDAYVIAEGIETIEALNFVRHGFTAERPYDAKVQGVQGYLLGRPDGASRGMAQSARTALIVRSTSTATGTHSEPPRNHSADRSEPQQLPADLSGAFALSENAIGA